MIAGRVSPPVASTQPPRAALEPQGCGACKLRQWPLRGRPAFGPGELFRCDGLIRRTFDNDGTETGITDDPASVIEWSEAAGSVEIGALSYDLRPGE